MSNETFRSKISLLGTKIKRGESICLEFNVAKLHSTDRVHVPVFIERAKKDGPVLLLMGGTHGDEINGIEIVRQIISKGHNKPKRGTVICIPVFNIFGFLNLSRKFPDGRDLNRSFPGSLRGSLASQYAYQFRKEIIPVVDYLIDFHTGGADRENVAQTRCMLEDEKAFALAKAFNAPFIVHSKTITKSIRQTFRNAGKTALLFEGGKSLQFDQEAINYGVNGAINVMRHLKMKGGKIKTNPDTVLIKSAKWLRSPYSGMFHPLVKNGGFVKKKMVMGLVTDPFGTFEKEVLAPFDCYVFCVNTAPIVNRGAALFHVSKEFEPVSGME